MELIRRLSGGRILDVATGQGDFIQFLLENLDDYEAIAAIDTQLAAALKDRPRVRLLQMDAGRMGFAGASFDAVCISNSLHHMADLPGVLAEMVRVLRPGGHFVVGEMYRDGQTEAQLTHVLLHHWTAAVDRTHGIPHGETYTRQEILDLLDGLGLEPVAVEDVRDLEADPRDPELMQHMEGVVDRFLARAAGTPDQAELQEQGEAVRRHLREFGMHGATSVMAVVRKP